jgi:hypothetical protein
MIHQSNFSEKLVENEDDSSARYQGSSKKQQHFYRYGENVQHHIMVD